MLGAPVLVHRLLLAPLHYHGSLPLLDFVHGTLQYSPPVIVADGLHQGYHKDCDQR